MIDSPIDKLLEITGCKYALVCLISKRARLILDRREESSTVQTSARAVSAASREIHAGDIVAGTEDSFAVV